MELLISQLDVLDEQIQDVDGADNAVFRIEEHDEIIDVDI